MTLIAHLVRHDLRTHRIEIVAWLALVAVHVPLGFAIAGGVRPVHSEVATPVLLVVRVALAAMLTASMLQADAPSDDRTFWRTRPIPRASMTLAKVGLVAAVFLGAPLSVVLVEAVWLRVPVSHVPTIVFDVLVQDGALVGLMALVASLTKRIASMVLALAASGATLFLLLATAGTVLRLPQVRVMLPSAPRYAETVLPALGLILAVTTLTMTVYTWRHTARTRALAVMGTTGLAAAIAAICMPPLQAQTGRARVDAGRADVVGHTLRATSAGREVFVSARLRLDGLSTEGGGTLRLVDGVLDVEGRRHVLDDMPHEFAPGGPYLRVALLSRETFGEIAGRRGRLTGTLLGDVEQFERLGRLPLRRGASLSTDGLRLDVLATAPAGTSSLARLAVTWTRRQRADFTSARTRLRLRSGSGSQTFGVPVTPSTVTVLDTAMLPTLAAPFGYRTVLVDDAFVPGTPPAGPNAWLDVLAPSTYARGEWQVDTDVTIPGVGNQPGAMQPR